VPGLSESTLIVNVPEDVTDCAGWGDPGRDCGVDGDGVVDVHPPKITHADRIIARNRNQRICITEQQHPG
jgi:hypothetical protein